jgi:hypothetical protein
VGPTLTICQDFSISAYRRIGGREFCLESPEGEKESEPSICGRMRVAESSISEIQAQGLTEASILTSRVVKSRGNLSCSSESGRVSRDRPYQRFIDQDS